MNRIMSFMFKFIYFNDSKHIFCYFQCWNKILYLFNYHILIFCRNPIKREKQLDENNTAYIFPINIL